MKNEAFVILAKVKKKHHPNKKYKDPVPTIDVIVRRPGNEILVERRGIPPFKDMYCLPGGHVEYGETVEKAALRELKEECGVRPKLIGILGVYSDPRRDPRGHRITIVFLSDYVGGKIKAGDDAAQVKWIKLSKLLGEPKKMAFDHRLILLDYQNWLVSRNCPTFWSSKRR